MQIEWKEKNVILHIFMYNVISDFSIATPASEGRVNVALCYTPSAFLGLLICWKTGIRWMAIGLKP